MEIYPIGIRDAFAQRHLLMCSLTGIRIQTNWAGCGDTQTFQATKVLGLPISSAAPVPGLAFSLWLTYADSFSMIAHLPHGNVVATDT